VLKALMKFIFGEKQQEPVSKIWSNAPEARGRTGLTPEELGDDYEGPGNVVKVGPRAIVEVYAEHTVAATGEVIDLGLVQEMEIE